MRDIKKQIKSQSIYIQVRLVKQTAWWEYEIFGFRISVAC